MESETTARGDPSVTEPPPTRKVVFVSLHNDALAALATLATERKRGDLISHLIRQEYQAHQLTPTGPQLAAELRALATQLEKL